MVHFRGFLHRLSKITNISETEFPLLENYIGDFYQLGFYYDPYPAIIPYKDRYIITKIGGFTAHLEKPLKFPNGRQTYSPYFINLYTLIRASLTIKQEPKIFFPVLVPDFNKLVEAFVTFQFHEFLHIIGISERGIRALRKMKIDV